MREFVGCSSEMHDKSLAIIFWLRDHVNETIKFVHWTEWFKDAPNNEVTWEGIYRAANHNTDNWEFDCALMLFSGDDKAIIRDKTCLVTRDNVILETGVFASQLGKEKVIILCDNRTDYHFLSDFAGLNPKRFDYTNNHTSSANLAVLEEIVDTLNRLVSDELPPDYSRKISTTKEYDETKDPPPDFSSQQIRVHKPIDF